MEAPGPIAEVRAVGRATTPAGGQKDYGVDRSEELAPRPSWAGEVQVKPTRDQGARAAQRCKKRLRPESIARPFFAEGFGPHDRIGATDSFGLGLTIVQHPDHGGDRGADDTGE